MEPPVYNPRKLGVYSISYYRNTSSAFGNKMKSFLLSIGDNECAKCYTRENLTIDHIISVWLAHKYKLDIRELNSYRNFQMLCGSCNMAKSPNEYELALNFVKRDGRPLDIENILIQHWERYNA